MKDRRQNKLSLCAQPVLHVVATEPLVPRNLAARAAVTPLENLNNSHLVSQVVSAYSQGSCSWFCSDGVLWCVPCCVLLPAGSDLDFALAGWVLGPDDRQIELYEYVRNIVPCFGVLCCVMLCLQAVILTLRWLAGCWEKMTGR